MILWRTAQRRLGVKQDGQFGPVSYTALLGHVAGRAVEQDIGEALADHAATYEVDTNANRLSAFVGECAFESGGFAYLREVWGPTAAQSRYDAPGNGLGNAHGDGWKYRGGGLIEVTGRHWFDVIGHALGMDLLTHPELIATPDVVVRASLEWWRMNNMNALADKGDWAAVTKRINGGLTAQPARVAYIEKALEVLR